MRPGAVEREWAVPDWTVSIAISIWVTVKMAAPWILIGLLVSGLLYVYLPARFVRKAMGGAGLGAVLRAALVGAPLPLCSCGVIPTALYLRREGAGRGPVLSFLISTPETNVDSVAFTWALMGPLMAVARPLAAIISAVVAGTGEALFGAPDTHAEGKGECGCGLCQAGHSAGTGSKGGFCSALRYGAVTLMRDLAPWLVLGLGLAGVIGALVPPKFFEENNLGSGILPMLLMAAVAAPMYMCATASTPVAAALVAKGVSPGAALVLLLVGPATNIATMTTVGRFLGRRSLAIYLSAMLGTSLLLGFGLDALAGDRIAASVAELGGQNHGSPWLEAAMLGSTVAFLLLLANGLRLRLVTCWMAWRSRRNSAARPPAPADGVEPDCGSGCCQSVTRCEDEACESESHSDAPGSQASDDVQDHPGRGACPHCR